MLAFWLAVSAAGVFVLVVGTRRPTLAERVAAMRPRPMATQRPRASVFKVAALESLLRPGLERVGGHVGTLLRYLGVDPDETARLLALAGRPEGVALYLGTKALFVVAGLGALPLLAGARLLPIAPAWAALLVAPAAFVLPDVLLREVGHCVAHRAEPGPANRAEDP